MSSTPEPKHLSSNHRDTLLQIFEHPTSHNVEWHAVLSLLEAAGTVEKRPDGKYAVKVGGEELVVRPPKDKDIDVDEVLGLRHMLTSVGYDKVASELEAKGKEA